MRFGLISLHRAWIAVAAILLAVHWSSPTFKPRDILRSGAEADHAFTSFDAGAYRSTLPRMLARNADAGPSKLGRGIGPADGKLGTLPQDIQVAGAHQRPAVLRIAETTRPPLPTAQAFDARGPPQASA